MDITTIVTIALLALTGVSAAVVVAQSATTDNSRRLARVERKVNRLLMSAHVEDGNGPTPAWSDDDARRALQDRPGVARLERKLDALLARMSVSYVGDSVDPVRNLARAGNKIGAIKRYRDQHPGVGLREAKEMVDAIQEEDHIS